MESVDNKNTSVLSMESSSFGELQALTRLLIDSERGFKEAASSVKHDEVALLFRSFVGERARMATVLQDLVRDHGDDGTTSGTMAGTVHRSWLDLRSALSGQDTFAVLAEAERGEGYLKAQFQRVLKLHWPKSIRVILSAQDVSIEEAYRKVRELRDSFSKKSSIQGSRNEDPISGEPGAHVLGTGVGTAIGGAAAGALAGTVAGPIGAVVGAVIGGVAGGLGGKAASESINPTSESAYWREAYSSRPYFSNKFAYEDFEPAYQVGWESVGGGESWEEIELNARQRYETRSRRAMDGSPSLAWKEAREAAKDAYRRAQENRSV